MEIRTLAVISLLLAVDARSQSVQNALAFDGVAGEVSAIAAPLLTGSTGYSLTCWVRPTSSNTIWTAFDGIAGFRNDLNGDFHLIQTDSVSLVGRYRNNAGVYTDVVHPSLALNTWQHLGLTYDGATLKLYINGSAVDSASATGLMNSNAGPFRIGNLFYTPITNFRTTGEVDEVSFWSLGLNAQQMACISQSGIDPSTPGLELYYKCDQGIAGGNNTAITTLTDATGQADGTLTGMTMNGAISNFVAGVNVGTAAGSTTTAQICQGESYMFNGQTLTASGTYSASFSTGGVCDSLATLVLTVVNVNVNVIQSGGNLVSQAINAQYQWLDCGNAYAEIPGATGPSYDYTMTGSYAVEVTQNGCVDTSACIAVSTIGIGETLALNDLRVRFDATQDAVVVSWNGAVAGLQVTMVDPRGRLVASVPARSGRTLVPTAGAPAGIYVVIVTDGTRQRSFRVPVIR